MASKKPWTRENPRRESEKLSASSKAKARASARRAGRTYPSLVDNMTAAKKQARKAGAKSRRGTKR